MAAEEEDDQRTRSGKERSGEGDVDSRIQVQLEEDGGGSSEQSSMWRKVACGYVPAGRNKV